MNKKKLFTFASITTMILAISSSAMACHIFTKKSSEQKNWDTRCQETQNKTDKENITVEKYAIPSEIIVEPQLLKYGIPDIIDNSDKNPVLKYAMPTLPPEDINKDRDENVIMPMYALPMQDEK